MNDDKFFLFKKSVVEERKIVNEMTNLLLNSSKIRSQREQEMVNVQFEKLRKNLFDANEELSKNVESISLVRPLKPKDENVEKEIEQKTQAQEKQIPVLNVNLQKPVKIKIEQMEKDILKRLKKKPREIKEKKMKKPSYYVKISNQIFSKTSISLLEKESFKTMRKDLTKANLNILPASYISVVFFTTLLAAFGAFILTVFLLFFNISLSLPIITAVSENIASRLLKVFWVFLGVPLVVFLFMYFYPAMESRSNENKINQELPFAAIHMSAISESLIDPSKIFEILISTEEYPNISKEFTKLLNEINIYGFDLVSALRSTATNSPSKKLSDLLNGLATTLTSGGNLPEFFDGRSQTLLFDYRIEREKYTRSAETFMDIYISLVIAAPMILMLLLMMIKISGLGISLSTSTITLIMVLGVSMINVVFLAFLHLKQPGS